MYIPLLKKMLMSHSYLLLCLLPFIFIGAVILASLVGLLYIGISDQIGFDYTIGVYVIITIILGGFLLISLFLTISNLANGIFRFTIHDWHGCENILASLLIFAFLAGEVYVLLYV